MHIQCTPVMSKPFAQSCRSRESKIAEAEIRINVIFKWSAVTHKISNRLNLLLNVTFLQENKDKRKIKCRKLPS